MRALAKDGAHTAVVHAVCALIKFATQVNFSQMKHEKMAYVIIHRIFDLTYYSHPPKHHCPYY